MQVIAQPLAEVIGVAPGHHRDQLTAADQQPVQQVHANGEHVGPDNGDVVIDEAEHVATSADPGAGEGVLLGDRDLGMAGRTRSPRHRDHVVFKTGGRRRARRARRAP